MYSFHPAAEAEHLELVAYYESKRAGLGATYLVEFEQTLVDVCKAPHRYVIVQSPDIRQQVMKKFPFTVLYRETSGNVQVLAIAHHRRRPDYWSGRVK